MGLTSKKETLRVGRAATPVMTTRLLRSKKLDEFQYFSRAALSTSSGRYY